MKRSARLDKFAELNAGIENNAGALLATAQSLYDKQLSQLEKLQLYKSEYEQRLNDKLPHSQSATSIHDYHQFIASLNAAIAQQLAMVRQCEKKVAAARANWLAKKQDVAKMSKAADSMRRKEHTVARRREQNESDEMTLIKLAHNRQADKFTL